MFLRIRYKKSACFFGALFAVKRNPACDLSKKGAELFRAFNILVA